MSARVSALRRSALVIAALLGLQACGQGEQVVPPVPQGRALQVASAGSANGIFVVPIGFNDGVETWIAPDNSTLSTRGGLVVATRGSGNDLMTAEVSGRLRMLKTGSTGGYDVFMTYLNPEGEEVLRTFYCEVVSRTPNQEINQRDGRRLLLTQVAERCTSPGIETQNLYWVDRSGTIYVSRQWIGGALGALDIATMPAVAQ